MPNNEIPGKAYKLAFEYESKYGNCPQCVFAAVNEVFSLGLGETLKSAHGLAGGLGLTGCGTCGALTGGTMILSHFYGRDRKNFNKKFQKSYKKAKKLYDKFVEEYGGCTCQSSRENLWSFLQFVG